MTALDLEKQLLRVLAQDSTRCGSISVEHFAATEVSDATHELSEAGVATRPQASIDASVRQSESGKKARSSAAQQGHQTAAQPAIANKRSRLQSMAASVQSSLQLALWREQHGCAVMVCQRLGMTETGIDDLLTLTAVPLATLAFYVGLAVANLVALVISYIWGVLHLPAALQLSVLSCASTDFVLLCCFHTFILKYGFKYAQRHPGQAFTLLVIEVLVSMFMTCVAHRFIAISVTRP
jgi:hypothetical protein